MTDTNEAVSLPQEMLGITRGVEGQMRKSQSDLEAAQKDTEAATQKQVEAGKGVVTEMQRQQQQTKDFSKEHPIPTTHLEPWTQKEPQSNPMSAFGSWASAFGIIAGAVTKTGLASSLNASAAAINAIHQNDLAAYKDAREAWKDNTEIAIKNAEWEHKSYQEAFELMKTDQAAGLALAQAVATQAGNDAMLAKLKEGNIKDAWEMAKGMGDFAMQGMEHMASVEKLGQQMQDYMERRDIWNQWKAKNPNATPQEQAQALTQIMSPQYTINQAKTIAESGGAGGLGMMRGTPEYKNAVDYWSKRVRAGEPIPPLGIGKEAAQFRRDIAMAAAQNAYETGGSAELDIAKKSLLSAEKESLKKQVASQHAINQFEETASKNLDIALQLVDKVDNTGIPVAERWLRGGMVAISGDPDVTKFNFQMDILANEVAKIITNPNLAGILSDSARAEGQALLSRNITATQLKELLPLIKGDFQRRKDAISDEINATTETITKLGAMTADSLKKKTSSDTSQKHSVGDEVTQGGKKYKVTKVDADGKILETEDAP